jgi:peptidylprolyl isomerase
MFTRGSREPLRRAASAWTVLVGLALLLAACGGSGSDSPAPATGQTQSEAETTLAGEADVEEGGGQALTQEVPAPGEEAGEEMVVEEDGEADAAEDDVRRAQDGDSVSVFYHGTFPSGEIFDSGRDRGQPFPFVVGTGQVILGFDDAVRGLAVGEIVTVTVPPARAYGEVNPDLILETPLDEAPEGAQEGDQLTFANGARGVVVSVENGIVTIDANHNLAGQTLIFEIELLTLE